MEPFFSVVLSSIFLGDKPTVLIVLSLFPIVGGVAAASISEVSFLCYLMQLSRLVICCNALETTLLSLIDTLSRNFLH